MNGRDEGMKCTRKRKKRIAGWGVNKIVLTRDTHLMQQFIYYYK